MIANYETLLAIDRELATVIRRRNRMEQALHAGIWLFLGCALAAVLDAFLFHTDLSILAIFLLAPLGMILIFVGLIGGWLVSLAEKRLVAHCTPAVLAQAMDRLDRYDPKGQVDKNYLEEGFGFPNYDQIRGRRDYVRGVLRGISLEFGEFRLEEGQWERDADGEDHKTYVTVFSGLLAVCRHNLALGSDVAVTQFTMPHDRRKTGEPAFDDVFCLLEGDERDVDLALTPQYRSQLTQLTYERGRSFALRFRRDGVLLLILRGWDLFELGESTNAAQLIEKLERDITELGDVLEVLALPARREGGPAFQEIPLSCG